MFYGQIEMKLEISNRKKFVKSTNVGKLNNTLVNNQKVKREIAKCFEMNEDKIINT